MYLAQRLFISFSFLVFISWERYTGCTGCCSLSFCYFSSIGSGEFGGKGVNPFRLLVSFVGMNILGAKSVYSFFSWKRNTIYKDY